MSGTQTSQLKPIIFTIFLTAIYSEELINVTDHILENKKIAE